MKTKAETKAIFVIGVISVILWPSSALCHDVPVHKGITANAAAAAFGASPAYIHFLNVVSTEKGSTHSLEGSYNLDAFNFTAHEFRFHLRNPDLASFVPGNALLGLA